MPERRARAREAVAESGVVLIPMSIPPPTVSTCRDFTMIQIRFRPMDARRGTVGVGVGIGIVRLARWTTAQLAARFGTAIACPKPLSFHAIPIPIPTPFRQTPDADRRRQRPLWWGGHSCLPHTMTRRRLDPDSKTSGADRNVYPTVFCNSLSGTGTKTSGFLALLQRAA